MREADNISLSIFLSVVGVYVVRTSSLNDKHSCQLFRKASSLFFFLLLSVATANLSCLLETTFSNFTSLQSFESVQRGFLFSFSGVILNPQPFFPLFFCLFTLSFSYLSERFFFVHDKAALARSRNQ